ncbi:MAG TPA: NUDIX domain-containing protein [Xanthobacteraceae bacterium]|nr:NUDIX domain-containing protein [Xanthobacteraceae bacterium]
MPVFLAALRDRFACALTLGVRGAVLSQDGRVFLVRHRYAPGWQFPGGGVERGESFGSALARELLEEGAIELVGAPALHGLYFHPRYSRRDHVALFVVRSFRQREGQRRSAEIAESGFFPLEGLPAGTTRATHARLAEILLGAPVSERW